ncbi:hypothetical protein GCM10028799_41380 [Kribbella italica]
MTLSSWVQTVARGNLLGKIFPVLTTLESPQPAVADQSAAPRASFYALVDRLRLRWFRLHRRRLAEALTGVTSLILALTAFAVAGRL